MVGEVLNCTLDYHKTGNTKHKKIKITKNFLDVSFKSYEYYLIFKLLIKTLNTHYKYTKKTN